MAEPTKTYEPRPDGDRRIRQAARMARILRVLELIQSRGRWNAKALAAELECDERTIYRDLKVLEFAGIPWFYSEADQCYRVRPDCRFPTLNLTPDELVEQSVATAAVRATGFGVPGEDAAATRKLAAVSGDEAGAIIADATEMIAVFDHQAVDHHDHVEKIRTAQWALLRRKQLTGRYRSPHQEEEVELDVVPYRLCFIRGVWYLIGRLGDDEQPKTTRVSRFRTLRMTDNDADVPDEFDLREYFGNAWSVFREPVRHQVTLRFTPDVADVVEEVRWHHSQRSSRLPDDQLELRFEVDGLRELLRWVLQWTGSVEVVEPPELRHRFLEKLQQGIAQNKIAS